MRQPGREGRQQHFKGTLNYNLLKNGKIVTAEQLQQLTDWSAILQIEIGWLFLSKGIGPNETKRQLAAAVPNQWEIL